jgi:hypothetical protein
VDTERGRNYFHIKLTAEEVHRVQAGGVVGDRNGLTPDSKVIVAPLGQIQEDDSGAYRDDDRRTTIADLSPARCRVDSDSDMTVFVPEIALVDSRTPGVEIPLERIEVPEGFEALAENIPPSGVLVHFGGSVVRYSMERIDPEVQFRN